MGHLVKEEDQKNIQKFLPKPQQIIYCPKNRTAKMLLRASRVQITKIAGEIFPQHHKVAACLASCISYTSWLLNQNKHYESYVWFMVCQAQKTACKSSFFMLHHVVIALA